MIDNKSVVSYMMAGMLIQSHNRAWTVHTYVRMYVQVYAKQKYQGHKNARLTLQMA